MDHDALVVKEGRTHHPQTPQHHVLYRGVHGVERIILLSPSGSLSFDAIRWCHEQSITVMLLDRDGQLLECLGPQQPGDLAVRRAQYMAGITARDAAVAQWLVRRKIQGQRETLVLPYAGWTVSEWGREPNSFVRCSQLTIYLRCKKCLVII